MRQHAGTTTKILCRSAVARSWGVRLKKVLLRIFRTFLKQPVRADRPGVILVIAEPLVPKAQKKQAWRRRYTCLLFFAIARSDGCRWLW